ncbi:MAG TPA: tail fiber protein [Usitatibacter sp.]|nr:tail fiber protein [Usitatibacter sp.]
MGQPTAYEITTDFSQEEAAGVAGRSEVRTEALDVELANISTSISEIISRLGLIQRDDGKLNDFSVELHTLSTEVLALLGSGGFTINNPIGWLTATGYAARSIVKNGTGTYVCVVAHTSGTFATDLAAGKWVVIFDSATYVASAVTVTPAGGITSGQVQAALEELDTKKMAKSANLSDVASASSARDNLSVPSRAGIQQSTHNHCVAAGTIDVITGAYSPAITALTNGMLLMFEAIGANATTTPTFNPDGVGAATIVRPDGSALLVGDIPSANYRALLVYDTSIAKWLLLNPFYPSPTPGTAGYVLTSNGPGVAPSYQTPATAVGRIGSVAWWPGPTLPSNALECDGTAYSRTAFAALFAALVKSATATMTIASPCVVTWTGHGLQNNMPVKFTTTGALPTGLTAGRRYWIVNKATDTFQVALTPGGTAINTSGSQSGTHTAICAPAGDGDGSTTFNVPNAVDKALLGYGTSVETETFAPADVTTGTDNIAIPDNVAKWITGMAVVFTSTGTPPNPLVNSTTYYIVRNGTGGVKLASSLANAQNGTVIDITTQGTGVHTLTHTRPTRGLGEVLGEDVHAMSSAELLAHAHGISVYQTTGVSGGGAEAARIPTGGSTNVAGGNAAMNIMGPGIAGRWIIYYA